MTGGPIFVGVDVGGTKCLAVAVEAGLGSDETPSQVVAEAVASTPAGADGQALAATVIGLVESVLVGAGSAGPGPAPVLAGVGVGLPGLVDRSGALMFVAHLPAAAGTGIAPVLRDRFGVPVVLDNDATCAALAEWALPNGAARGVDDAVVVTLGTGIGAGFVLGGRLHRGRHGFAGEIGHTVVDPTGPPCPCGRRGCWERFASGSALVAAASAAGFGDRGSAGDGGSVGDGGSGAAGGFGADGGSAGTGDGLEGGQGGGARGRSGGGGGPDRSRRVASVLADLVAAGDRRAAGVVDAFGHRVAEGLAPLVEALDLGLVVLGGGVLEGGSVVVDAVGRALADRTGVPVRRPRVPVVAAAMGARAGAVGAALLAAGADQPEPG